MYGMDKTKMRMMAMDKMRKEKPSIEMKPKMAMKMESPEGMEMGEADGMMGEEGFVQMMVSPEEKEILMNMRKKMGMGSKIESPEMEDEEMA